VEPVGCFSELAELDVELANCTAPTAVHYNLLSGSENPKCCCSVAESCLTAHETAVSSFYQ
jgi:hypothetical protein